MGRGSELVFFDLFPLKIKPSPSFVLMRMKFRP